MNKQSNQRPEVPRPKRLRDWVGGFVTFDCDITTSLMSIPAGTIFKVVATGRYARIESVPCPCCGVRMRAVLTGRGKFDRARYLGRSA